ncbi:MAG: hypothetical protein OXG30_08535 [bacterium]|nr:hypothetical protein [bacterium]
MTQWIGLTCLCAAFTVSKLAWLRLLCILGLPRPGSHPRKEQEARQLASVHGLPDVGDLLIDLNNMRKHKAYGDIGPPGNLDPQDVANDVEEYVEAVKRLLSP